MSHLHELVKSADWKSEKHVPVIDAPDTAKADEWTVISATVGKEIAHPNTTEHHICWIALHYAPEGSSVSYELGRFEFSAHGQSAKGANQGPAFTDSTVTIRAKLLSSGRLFATAYCNIHGLWESGKSITIA